MENFYIGQVVEVIQGESDYRGSQGEVVNYGREYCQVKFEDGVVETFFFTEVSEA